MLLMKTLLTSRCINQRGAGHHVAEKIKQLMAGADFINEIKEVLLAYISLLAIRTPGMRNYIESKLIKLLNKLMVNAMVATPEQYSDILFRMQVE